MALNCFPGKTRASPENILVSFQTIFFTQVIPPLPHTHTHTHTLTYRTSSSLSSQLVNTVISNTNETRTQAKFGPALERAFQVLSNSSECHKTMVIFTDGDEVTASTFDTLNADKAVTYRVFGLCLECVPVRTHTHTTHTHTHTHTQHTHAHAHTHTHTHTHAHAHAHAHTHTHRV